MAWEDLVEKMRAGEFKRNSALGSDSLPAPYDSEPVTLPITSHSVAGLPHPTWESYTGERTKLHRDHDTDAWPFWFWRVNIHAEYRLEYPLGLSL